MLYIQLQTYVHRRDMASGGEHTTFAIFGSMWTGAILAKSCQERDQSFQVLAKTCST